MAPYKLDSSFLTLSFDYRTASSRAEVFICWFLLLPFRRGRCPPMVVSLGLIHFMWRVPPGSTELHLSAGVAHPRDSYHLILKSKMSASASVV
jgi:hypothetical protein